MVKMIALYKQPQDIEQFNEHYFGTHVPLNGKTPGLLRTEVSRFVDLRGGETEYFLMAEMYFESRERLMASFRTPESAAAREDLMSFADGLVTFWFAEVIQ